MKKYIKDFMVVENRHIHANYSLLMLAPEDGQLPEMEPGQFVQVAVDNSKTTYLRRPISINNVDTDKGQLWLLVRNAGAGTAALMALKSGARLNLVLPLGNTFTVPADQGASALLVGGGVGVAPMLYCGRRLKSLGIEPCFLLGARSAADVLELDEFRNIGEVYISTEDGSLGEKGLVTHNRALQRPWDYIYCCGPAPMMKAVAAMAKKLGACCEVSLENMMACGLGACLCCVENTVKGNVCVCTEGPVFNINQLTWQD
ncbi:MAG: dihydroorotate dehydrogenase electron transfer subunit [Pseudoflavonifractor sp.]|nr:dihydroorotate dehydrogenase electron transfer subunit [Pseudoflavonifractor sp.]